MKHFLPLAAAGIGAYFLSTMPCLKKHPEERSFKNRNFAHRGLFDNLHVFENSLTAFRAAAEAEYGIELDLQMSADGQIVVFHDTSMERLCGVDLKPADCSYSLISQYKLGSSMDSIPLFSQVLNLVAGRVPLIVEIKTTEQINKTCLRVYDLLRRYPGPVCIESMNPLIVGWFAKNAPQIMRGQLVTRFDRDGALGAIGSSALSNLMFNFISSPHFIACDHRYCDSLSQRFCKKAGAFTVAWTIREQDYDWAAQNFDAIIFEGFRPPVSIR